MITLPSRPESADEAASVTSEPKSTSEEPADQSASAVSARLTEPRPSMTSIYDAIDHNLITFDNT